jgi:hypothetical protein
MHSLPIAVIRYNGSFTKLESSFLNNAYHGIRYELASLGMQEMNDAMAPTFAHR